MPAIRSISKSSSRISILAAIIESFAGDEDNLRQVITDLI
jgi:hypothetical protein